MRDQYAGDISDLLKFSLLRSLAGADRKLGIAWYYVDENDGRSDGVHVGWMNDPKWFELDRFVASGLSQLRHRSVVALEQIPALAEQAVFHSVPVPASLDRARWAEVKRASLETADLVFLDPDNGLGPPKRKHATLDELMRLRRPGRAICFITFPKRVNHELQLTQLHSRLRSEGATSIATIRTCVSLRRPGAGAVTPTFRWFTVVDIDGPMLGRLQAYSLRLGSMPRTKSIVHID